MAITASAQQLFTLIVGLIAEPGDVIAIEEPWYHRFRDTLVLAGVEVMPVPTDGEGIDVFAMQQLVLEKGVAPKLVYVTPSHQFPSGVVMSLSRRLALLEWCEANNVWVIEDDYDSEFRYQGQPIDALKALDRQGRVIYVATVSKALFPSLRIAYGVFPRVWMPLIVRALWQVYRHAPWMEQHMLAEFIESGGFASHIRRQRRNYALQRQTLVDELQKALGERVQIQGSEAGLHLLIWLPEYLYSQQAVVLEALENHGVRAYPIDHLYSQPTPYLGLLLGYATLTPKAIQLGVNRLVSALGSVSVLSLR